MSEKEIVNKILCIIGNFKLSENIQLKELTALYMKQEEEIERLHSIIKEVREYIEEVQVYDYEFREYVVQVKELLEILEKENK